MTYNTKLNIQLFLVYGLIFIMVMGLGYCTYQICKEREPGRIGSIEVENRSHCINSYRTCTTHYNPHTKTNSKDCNTRCSAYMCQEVTTRIGKHIWNDETLNVKDLYSGRCRTEANVRDW